LITLNDNVVIQKKRFLQGDGAKPRGDKPKRSFPLFMGAAGRARHSCMKREEGSHPI
jgi:hypothetical protein